MGTSSTRVVVFLVAIVAAVALFVVLQNSGDDDSDSTTTNTPAAQSTDATVPPAEPSPPTIVVRNGEPVGGVAEIDLQKGDRIQFVVKSDVDEEIHLHGYDVSKPIKAGGTVTYDVPATIEGVFELELEESAVPIAEIRVNP